MMNKTSDISSAPNGVRANSWMNRAWAAVLMSTLAVALTGCSVDSADNDNDNDDDATFSTDALSGNDYSSSRNTAIISRATMNSLKSDGANLDFFTRFGNAGFTGVLVFGTPGCEEILIVPSGDTRLRNGDTPELRVPRNGGHDYAAAFLSALLIGRNSTCPVYNTNGGNQPNYAGFAITKDSEDTYELAYVSGILNERRDRLATASERRTIRLQVERMLGY